MKSVRLWYPASELDSDLTIKYGSDQEFKVILGGLRRTNGLVADDFAGTVSFFRRVAGKPREQLAQIATEISPHLHTLAANLFEGFAAYLNEQDEDLILEAAELTQPTLTHVHLVDMDAPKGSQLRTVGYGAIISVVLDDPDLIQDFLSGADLSKMPLEFECETSL